MRRHSRLSSSIGAWMAPLQYLFLSLQCSQQSGWGPGLHCKSLLAIITTLIGHFYLYRVITWHTSTSIFDRLSRRRSVIFDNMNILLLSHAMSLTFNECSNGQGGWIYQIISAGCVGWLLYNATTRHNRGFVNSLELENTGVHMERMSITNQFSVSYDMYVPQQGIEKPPKNHGYMVKGKGMWKEESRCGSREMFLDVMNTSSSLTMHSPTMNPRLKQCGIRWKRKSVRRTRCYRSIVGWRFPHLGTIW